ncbi:MAG: DNA alkylation repair protein [Bacteroidaceae bacterium]
MKTLIQEIKAELRANMNGVASKMMRDAGMTADYRLNFGIEIPRIQAIANDIATNMLPKGQNPQQQLQSLAQQLWKESVRECRILATMLYPSQLMEPDLADLWTDDIRTVEIAQLAALYLFSKIPAASQAAFRWIADEREMKQITGFYTILHLIRTRRLNPRAKDELHDQAQVAAQTDNNHLRAVATKILNRIEG